MNGQKISSTEYKSESITVRKASISDFPALEKVLARAFDDLPGTNWVCLQDRHRTERVQKFMSLGLHLALPFGEIYTTRDQTGAAMWLPPGKTTSVVTGITKGIGVTGVRHGICAGIISMMIEKHNPKIPHWELLEFGVEPSLQGKGIGCALLQPILNRCDQEHIPAYVVTQTEKNIQFYERRGFKVKDRLNLPFGFPETYCMWREPLSRQP